MITTQTIYFTMVHHPIKGRIRAGNACMTRKAAQEWLPMLRKMWRGCKTSVASCTLRYQDGRLTPKTIAVLDREAAIRDGVEPDLECDDETFRFAARSPEAFLEQYHHGDDYYYCARPEVLVWQ